MRSRVQKEKEGDHELIGGGDEEGAG